MKPAHDEAEPPRRAWLAGITGMVLALVLCSVGYVQWRQYQLLDNTAQFQNDALSWSFSQLETEHLRLRNRMQTALDDPRPDDAEILQARYDIFVSRIGLVDHTRAEHIMEGHAAYRPALDKVHAFVTEGDHYFGTGERQPLTPAAMKTLLVQLDGLNVPLHDLSLGASHLLYERAALRNAAVRQQSRLGLWLTLSQCLLLLVLGFIVLRQLRALTERRRALEALAASLGQARAEAESASRAKSVFLANMSHELRTPFHGLLGMLSLLRDTPLTPRQEGFLATAKESAHHLLEILNDILDISTLESGKLQMTPETIDLPRLVAQVDALTRVQAQAKGLGFQVSVAPDVPRWVRADATRLKQILFNLLSNAVKFSNGGTVSLAVTVGAAGGLDFVVADDGIGMDDALLERLFVRFVQGDGTPSRRHGGTGLGLEISRNLARLMGGDITVRSAPGEGSRFTASLPLPAVAAPIDAPSDPATEGEPAPRVLRVLVAEDHPVNRAYMEAVLDKLGHEAVFSEDGEGAVRAVQAQEFDVVLMDLHMPVMDGFAAARAIRAMPPPRGGVPIIALTADAFQEARDRAHDAGMNGFLTKPAHLPQLREALERHAPGGPALAHGHASGPEMPVESAMPGAADAHDSQLDRDTMRDVGLSLSPGQYAALLEHFFDDHAATLADLRRAVAAGMGNDVRATAHSLKGAALSLGLRGVARIAQQLQSAGPNASAGELSRLMDALEQHLEITREQCARLGLTTQPTQTTT